jgi:hypothetical protein
MRRRLGVFTHRSPALSAIAGAPALLFSGWVIVSGLALEGCGKHCAQGGSCACMGGGTGIASCNTSGDLIECRCTAVNMEGGACSPDGTPKGSCLDDANVCTTWSPPMSTDLIATCTRPCMSDADCGGSTVGHVCASVELDQKACVASVTGEGERVDVSLSHGRPMTGCRAPLQAVHRLYGSLLLDLEDDQASCGRRCASDGECTGAAPTCTLGVFSSTAAAAGPEGVCTVRRAGKGARCSLRSIIEACDTSLSKNMVCTDLGLQDADNQGDANKYGLCVEICDMTDMTCRASADGAHTASCEFGFFNDKDLGICDDRCRAFPDDCTGMGSPPAAGDTARGARCIPFRGSGTIDRPEQSLCLDVAQRGALLPAYDFKTAPASSCQGNPLACPDETICIGADPSTGSAVCAYGCTTMGGGPSGCESTGLSTCKQDFGTDTTAGICEPASSS